MTNTSNTNSTPSTPQSAKANFNAGPVTQLTPTQFPSFVLLGKKLGMTQIFSDTGDSIPVTALLVGPCVVIQKKVKSKETYNAVQLGFDDKKAQRVIKPEAGHFKAAKTPAKRFVQEFRLDDTTINELEVGQVLDASLLKIGDQVDISGTSIGKGFQGVMKRHNFRGARHSHNHEFFRHGGSIGMRSIPGRVFRGKKMPGHMGDRNVTTQNLKVVAIDAATNVVLVRGAVPGAKNGYITLQASKKGGFEKRSFKATPVETPAETPSEAQT